MRRSGSLSCEADCSDTASAASHSVAARRGGFGEQREPVPRAPGERRGEHRVQRLLVARVGERPQIAVQVPDLLASPERADRRERAQAAQLQRALENLDVAARPQQHHDLSGQRLAGLHELVHALGEQPRLGLAPGRGVRQAGGDRRGDSRVLLPAVLAAQEQLDDGSRGAGALSCSRPSRSGLKSAKRSAKAVLTSSSSSPRLRKLRVSERLRPDRSSSPAASAEQAHVGVAETVDRLQLVADREQVLTRERLESARAVGGWCPGTHRPSAARSARTMTPAGRRSRPAARPAINSRSSKSTLLRCAFSAS